MSEQPSPSVEERRDMLFEHLLERDAVMRNVMIMKRLHALDTITLKQDMQLLMLDPAGRVISVPSSTPRDGMWVEASASSFSLCYDRGAFSQNNTGRFRLPESIHMDCNSHIIIEFVILCADLTEKQWSLFVHGSELPEDKMHAMGFIPAMTHGVSERVTLIDGTFTTCEHIKPLASHWYRPPTCVILGQNVTARAKIALENEKIHSDIMCLSRPVIAALHGTSIKEVGKLLFIAMETKITRFGAAMIVSDILTTHNLQLTVFADTDDVAGMLGPFCKFLPSNGTDVTAMQQELDIIESMSLRNLGTVMERLHVYNREIIAVIKCHQKSDQRTEIISLRLGDCCFALLQMPPRMNKPWMCTTKINRMSAEFDRCVYLYTVSRNLDAAYKGVGALMVAIVQAIANQWDVAVCLQPFHHDSTEQFHVSKNENIMRFYHQLGFVCSPAMYSKREDALHLVYRCGRNSM